MKHFLLISYEKLTGVFFTPCSVITKLSDDKKIDTDLIQNPQWQSKKMKE
jgi:hypothetical protein